jgi:hypothetical protein
MTPPHNTSLIAVLHRISDHLSERSQNVKFRFLFYTQYFLDQLLSSGYEFTMCQHFNYCPEAPGGCVCLKGSMVKALWTYANEFYATHGLPIEVSFDIHRILEYYINKFVSQVTWQDFLLYGTYEQLRRI